MQQALEELPGVAQAKADVDSQTATLQVDPEKFDSKQAVQALADVGFEGSTVVEKGAAAE